MTTFGTDKQTLSDLDIFPQYKKDSSVFGFFDKTATQGGSKELYAMLHSPLNDKKAIEERARTFRYLTDNNIEIPLDKDYLDFIEFYLNENVKPLKDHFIDAYVDGISYRVKSNSNYYVISRGVEYVKVHLISFLQALDDLPDTDLPLFFVNFKNELIAIKENRQTAAIFQKKQKISFRNVNRFDSLLRGSFLPAMRNILRNTYMLDAFQSVAKTAKAHAMCFPVFEDAQKPFLEIKQLFHPLLKNPVRNNIGIKEDDNLLFLTGSNMSGKSTFLKATGVCVYLAHAGFPVPAGHMRLSVYNGLYTTINLPDDIFKGFSHYYSEVRRLKDITLQLKEKKRVLVIFDELFRGTNVKDAFDATRLVISGFSNVKSSIFLISTHILEVGEKIRDQKGIVFNCFESSIKNDKPVYPYLLSNGISTERLGLTILRNEGVLALIEDISKGDT